MKKDWNHEGISPENIIEDAGGRDPDTGSIQGSGALAEDPDAWTDGLEDAIQLQTMLEQDDLKDVNRNQENDSLHGYEYDNDDLESYDGLSERIRSQRHTRGKSMNRSRSQSSDQNSGRSRSQSSDQNSGRSRNLYRQRQDRYDSRYRQEEDEEMDEDLEELLFMDEEGMQNHSAGKASHWKESSERESRKSGADSRTSGMLDTTKMSRKERKEYEEFLAYKNGRSRNTRDRNPHMFGDDWDEYENTDRSPRRGKKRNFGHRILLLIVILLVLVPLLYIGVRVTGIMDGISTADIKALISDEVKKSQETGAMAGYTNIALFGLDSTEESLDSGNNRSDVMIIASINDKTGDVKLVSLYRDTYLDIGDSNYQKANAAYAYGGPEQAIKMMNTNLDLNITDYVTIGFGGVADMIDAVGGIEIDVQSDEIEHLNNYQSTMAAELGKEYVPLTTTGLQTLNGVQATAYCRIRYTDGGDFKRTERQKEVLSKTFAKFKSAGPVAMVKAADSLASEMKTSLNAVKIVALALKAIRCNISETGGFPNEQYRTVGYIGDQSCVIPIHLTDNVTWLHQYLFGDSSYQVSETVQNISNQISAQSGY